MYKKAIEQSKFLRTSVSSQCHDENTHLVNCSMLLD